MFDQDSQKKTLVVSISSETEQMHRLLLSCAFCGIAAFPGHAETTPCAASYNAQDWARALTYCRLEAEQDNATALFNLGEIYWWGSAGERDAEQAMELLRRAAEQGYIPAQLSLGRKLSLVKQPIGSETPAKLFEEAIGWLEEAADRQSMEAAYLLSEIYGYVDLETGLRRNPELQVHWLAIAAERGSRSAQANVGWYYYWGEGVEVDYAKALQWWTVAAEQGSAFAQSNLGQMYFEGAGVPKDYVKAHALWTSAAESGDSWAQYGLGLLFHNGLGVAQDYTQAARWYERAAESDNPAAQYALGFLTQHGYGVAQNYREAFRLYYQSAASGNEQAQNNLGVMFARGLAVPQDFISAHMWYNIAAANGNDLARQNRDQLANSMTTEQIARAQERARLCMDNRYQNCGN